MIWVWPIKNKLKINTLPLGLQSKHETRTHKVRGRVTEGLSFEGGWGKLVDVFKQRFIFSNGRRPTDTTFPMVRNDAKNRGCNL